MLREDCRIKWDVASADVLSYNNATGNSFSVGTKTSIRYNRPIVIWLADSILKRQNSNIFKAEIMCSHITSVLAISPNRYRLLLNDGADFMLFIQYPPCSTCQKAKKWLEANGIVYTERNIKEQNPSYEELKAWYEASGLPF